MSVTKKDADLQHLERASENIAKWPRWKQDAAGVLVRKQPVRATRIGWETISGKKPESVTWVDCSAFLVGETGLTILHPDDTFTVVPIDNLKNIFFDSYCIERLRGDRG